MSAPPNSLSSGGVRPSLHVVQHKLEKVEGKYVDTSTESVSPQMPVKNGGSTGKSFAQAANWTVGLAAAILVMISVGGYFYHREQLAALATQHLRLIVTGPSALQAGVPAEYTILSLIHI